MGDSKIGGVSSEGDGRRSVADPSIEVKVCTVRATIQAERLPSEHSPFSKQTILVDEVCSRTNIIAITHPRRALNMTYDVPQLLSLSQTQLDELFTNSPAGDIPDGEAKGTAIIAPGTKYSTEIAELINHFAWQGKIFDATRGTLKNRILAFGLQAIIAKVYKGASWLDGKECIVLDYSETSLLAHRIRDEIRLIAPGRYLGVVYWGKKRLINFALQF